MGSRKVEHALHRDDLHLREIPWAVPEASEDERPVEVFWHLECISLQERHKRAHSLTGGEHEDHFEGAGEGDEGEVKDGGGLRCHTRASS